MRLRERLSAAVTAFKGTFDQGNWVDSDRPGNVGTNWGRTAWIPGTRINWDAVTGDIISCPAAQACFNWKARNRPQAPLIVEQRGAKEDWAAVEHPLSRKIRRPNPEYHGDTLLNMTSFSLDSNGNAYWLLEFTSGGEIGEIWWWPHHWVSLPPDTQDTIESYILTNMRGFRMEVPKERIVHFKFGLNPDDPRFGLSPLAAATRGIYSLQKAANYRASILMNMGVAGTIICTEDPDITPDPELVKKAFQDQPIGIVACRHALYRALCQRAEPYRHLYAVRQCGAALERDD